MKKVVRITESELKKIIQNIIEEQNLAVSQNFQKGQQSGIQAGQQARQVVNKAIQKAGENIQAGALSVAKAGKQVIVTIGKTTFTILTYGAAVVFLIGKGIYKVGAAIGNAILKFLSAVGNATVSAATAIGQSALNGLKTAGIAIEKGAQWVGQQLSSLADSGVSMIKWILGQFKALGAVAFAKVLLAANSVKEFGASVGNWIKQQYDSISASVGKKWDDAVAGVKQGWESAKSGMKSAYDSVSSTAANIGNKASEYAGNAWGAIKGFLSEFFERFISMENKSNVTLLSEMVNYNGKSIL